MEENVDSQMETDVSSTTQDILPVEMPQSTTTIVAETTVEVIELKEEDQDQSIDSNTPESKQPVEQKTPTKCPIKESNPSPIQRTPVKDTLPVSVRTPEKNTRISIKKTQDQVIQPVDKTLSESSKDIEKSSIIIDSTAINTVQAGQKTPEKIKEGVENVQNVEKKQEKTPEKVQTSTEIVEKVADKVITPEKVVDISNKVESGNETDANMSNQNEPLMESGDHETEEKDKDEVVVFVPIDMQTESISNDSQETLASVSETTSEKDHNKSISRELKSLIASAKESKIISECTQLTTKTRKSRQLLDSSNTSLNTSVDADKIQGIRRESSNSQKSSCSEKSEKINLKRSMRSQNPEFVTKNKQFLNTVNAKHTKDETGTEEPSDETKKKEPLNESTASTPKKKKMDEKQPPPHPPSLNSNKLRSDPYCWRCHWIEDDLDEKNPPAKCTVCPRTFHFKCLSGPERAKLSLEKNWVCPKCITVLHAESSETRSPVMRKVKLGMLCDLLKYAWQRMVELNGVEPFMTPVDRATFPDYDKYVVHAVDLTLMKDNIAGGVYGSTEAFVSDAQWILHNSIIFNTLQSKLTAAARALVRCCRAEMGEIEACPECYAGAHSRRPTWFTDVCSTPHILLWAKLKGFPYWPAKGMSTNSSGMVDVRFFGAHDRAWVPARDCFLYSEKDPNNFRTKRQDILDSMQEAEQHIRNISRKFGKFVYPAFKVQFDPGNLNEQLKIMIPSYKPECPSPPQALMKKPLGTPSPGKCRSASKTRKDSHKTDGEKIEEDAAENKTSNGTEKPAEEAKAAEKSENPMEVDGKNAEPEVTIVLRKRRKSVPARAHASEKRKRLASTGAATDATKTESDHKDNKTDTNKKEAKKTVDISESDDKPAASPKPQKDTDKVDKAPTTPRQTRASTPASTSKQANKQTPKVNTPKETDKVNTPKEADKVKKAKTAQSDSPSSDADKTQDDKIKYKVIVRAKKPGTPTPKSDKTPGKKNDANTSVNKDKSIDEANKSITDRNTSTPKAKTSKSLKDSIVFDDDDTSLAVLAKKNDPCFPTITNVRSLSHTDMTKTKSPVREATSTSCIFIPTSTDSVSTMKDAVARLQKLRSHTEAPLVGRVGVRAFARMTSPPAAKETPTSDADKVEVEVKAEPMDFEDADRQTEKLNLLNTMRLRPVNPPQMSNLRDVRINKVVAGPSVQCVRKPVQVKAPEIRPKARKTFPQPQKSGEGLGSKNSMVYIPIQPPMTQAPPARAAGAGRVTVSVNGPAGAPPALRPQMSLNSAVASSSNSMVNTVTTPVMTVVTPSSVTSNCSSVPTLTQMPTMAQMGQLTQLGTMGQLGQLGQMGPLGQVGQLGQVGSLGQVGGVPTTVHTVPMITSVNGQWTFSLQPMMSVGGVDRPPTPPLVNGAPEPSAVSSSSSQPVSPPSLTSVVAPANRSNEHTQPGEPPRLQQKPSLATPLDGGPAGEPPTPAAAGPVTALLNQNANKIADFFRAMLQDTIEKVDNPAAKLTALRLQMEQLQWRHKQELEEQKHNHQLVLVEMRTTFEKERVRLSEQARRNAQHETTAAVKHAKSRQWCANCQQEAQFYCCWNTSYCDYPCQRAHWPQHFYVCTQQRTHDNNNGKDNSVDLTEDSILPDNPPPKVGSSTVTVGGKVVPPRLCAPPAPPAGKPSIIVSMVEDKGGNPLVKCVGTYKPAAATPSPNSLLINKQIMNNEENAAAKKVVTSGGYLIVGANASGNPSLVLN